MNRACAALEATKSVLMSRVHSLVEMSCLCFASNLEQEIFFSGLL